MLEQLREGSKGWHSAWDLLARALARQDLPGGREEVTLDAPERIDDLAAHYAVGNVRYCNYWRAYDRVLAFNDERDGHGWAVKVQRVRRVLGGWVAEPGEAPRWHCTWPEPGDRIVARLSAPKPVRCYVGDFMLMGVDDGGRTHFKNRITRQYLILDICGGLVIPEPASKIADMGSAAYASYGEPEATMEAA